MTTFNLFSLLLGIAALFGIVNNRTLRLPTTAGMMLFAMAASVLLLLADHLWPSFHLAMRFRVMVEAADLPHTLLDGALSFLLFAGALQLDLPLLWSRKGTVLALSVPGTLLAVFLFGGPMWVVFHLMGAPASFIWCLVLGAILAPTDPVSVLAMLKRVGLPPALQAVFAGESLFNDGVAVVLFGATLTLATGPANSVSGLHIVLQFLLEAVGGGLLGVGAGWLAAALMRRVDDVSLDLLLSLALATGAYSLANALYMSGPIAAVTAGLFMATGAGQRTKAPEVRSEMLHFWVMTEEIFNALLFLLIGFELVSVTFHVTEILAAAIAIPISVAARGLSVWIATAPIKVEQGRRRPAVIVLTWGGLRGGISVAMALGVPNVEFRAPLLAVCYAVVVFTVVVQGLTTERLARYLYRNPS